MSQIQVTLTPAESKRLIAKAVATIPEIKRALKSGTIVIGLGTTNARVAEELLKRKVERDRFAAGVVLPAGTCIVPKERRLKEMVIRKGRVIDASMDDVMKELTPEDVFIKGANAIDSSGNAGVFLGSPSGGTVGRALGTVMAKGVNLIIPVGLEKFIPGSIQDVSKKAGIFRAVYATGCAVGIIPIPGKVITEIEAIEILSGAKAVVLGKGGVSGAEGSVTLLVRGNPAQVRDIKKLVILAKGEAGEKIEADRDFCKAKQCWHVKG